MGFFRLCLFSLELKDLIFGCFAENLMSMAIWVGLRISFGKVDMMKLKSF